LIIASINVHLGLLAKTISPQSKEKGSLAMKKIIRITILSWLTLFLPPLSQAGEVVHYSLQVKALPMAEQDKGLQLYEALKQKGYLVYYYVATVNDKEWLRVRVGHFADKEQAKQLGEKLKAAEGIDYFVEQTRLFVDTKNHIDVITTPSAVWLSSKNATKELYSFKGFNSLAFLENTQAVLSPSGKDLVFYDDHKLIQVTVANQTSQELVKEGLLNSQPAWSADGKYIGYIDYLEWETPSSLCLIKVADRQNTCLVKNNEQTQQAVKSFHWHPQKNLLFFVEGHATGTVSVGGNLYSVDLAGQRKEVVMAKPDNQEEISSEFSIQGNQIHYQVVQFDKDYNKQTGTKNLQVKLE
jgi:Domain of unknown function (DUF4652)/SPOR domain